MTIIISSDIEGDLTTSDFILGDATTINYHEESENEELHIIYPENFIQSEPPRDPDSVSVWDAEYDFLFRPTSVIWQYYDL